MFHKRLAPISRRLRTFLTITASASLLTIALWAVFPVFFGTGVSTAATEPPPSGFVYLPTVSTPPDNAWWMAAANPQRTSWTPEEVRGNLKVDWFKPFESYILPRVQIIAANDALFIATANGLYAIHAATGDELWVYPTELPLGHSPTYHDGVLYVGGFDHKLHAIDANSGQGLWTFTAGAGFDTNPLIVNGILYAGNRDGTFYALFISGPNQGTPAWTFDTDGPIHYSAAYADGTVYFASNDSHAYALDAANGSLIWKSAQLPGQGFHSWWPVVHENYVIFAGSNSYAVGQYLGSKTLHALDRDTIYPNRMNEPKGTIPGQMGFAPGDWAAGTPTIDLTKSSKTGTTMPVTEYFEEYPQRRTYFVLSRSNGQELTTDHDNDGKPEYAPMLWFSAKGSGNRYPPVVGIDGVLYQTNNYMSDPSIAGGQVSGWTLGTPYISPVSQDWGAVDEPHAYSAGGKLIYWSLCCDRQAGAVDVTIPNMLFYENYQNNKLPTSGNDPNRQFSYFGYNLADSLPGYNQFYSGEPNDVFGVFGDSNGLYGFHGDQNPPIPYQGRVYIHRSNSIIAFGPSPQIADELSVVSIVDTQDSVPTPTDQELQDRLAEEVQKILDAGHLRPGWATTGIFDVRARSVCGDDLIDYFHHPGDTLITLLRALPHLPSSMQAATSAYIQSEYNAYPPYEYNHIGWMDGAPREHYPLPPEIETGMASFGPLSGVNGFPAWDNKPNPMLFYSLWKYVEEFGGASTIYNASQNKLPPVPSESILVEMPHALNAFIAGYSGFLELEVLAGQPASPGVSQDLAYLLNLRVSAYSENAPPEYFDPQNFGKFYCRTLTASRNFMYLVPEVADHLRTNALGQVQSTIDTYNYLAPYWMASRAEVVIGEGILAPLYDPHAIFQARAWILLQSRAELAKYLDVPAFAVGDLFFIDKLVTLLEAPN